MALSEVFDQYLVHAFGCTKDYVHIPHITPALSDRFARQYLHDVEDQARRTCEAIYAVERRAAETVPA